MKIKGIIDTLIYVLLRSREYRFTHMNRSTVDTAFLSEALSGERISGDY